MAANVASQAPTTRMTIATPRAAQPVVTLGRGPFPDRLAAIPAAVASRSTLRIPVDRTTATAIGTAKTAAKNQENGTRA